jgi:hypothetical protein
MGAGEVAGGCGTSGVRGGLIVTVLIRFRERTGQVWLECDYDGLQPPLALFDDLRMIGWSPPVPAPPPASALDWSRADPTQGTSYTLRPFRVAGARIDGPRGAGRAGGWTVAERPVFLRTLEGVVRRHAADVVAHLPADAAPIGPAAETPVSPAPAPAPAPEPPEPAEPAEASGPTPTPGGRQRVVAVVDRAMAPVVLDQLRSRGLEPAATATTQTKLVRFRGNTQESQMPAVRIEVLVEGEEARQVQALLSFDRESVAVTVEPASAADGDGAAPDAAPPPTVEPPVAGGAPTIGGSVVEVLVPLALAPATRGRLEGRGLELVAESAVILVEGSFRGSSYVEQVPGQRFTIATDERHLEAVVELVVATTGIPRGDDRLVVRRPTPPVTGTDDTRPGPPDLRLVS